ncbi:hypothetical protein [Streptomyces sp. NPDC056049]|uniref:hypothetical protein n=1 Tax=Streptomyces sp. NPDC056049 TaxID=3345693 RepID=UPI0035DA0E63
MTDQPFQPATAEDETDPDTPATNAELRQAVQAVLALRANTIPFWARDTAKTASLDGHLQHVPDGPRRVLWRALVKEWLKVRSDALLAALRPLLDDSIKVAMSSFVGVQHGLVHGDLSPQLTEDAVQRLEQFVYDTDFAKAADAHLVSLKAEFLAYCARAAELEPYLEECREGLVKAHTDLKTAVQQVNAQKQQVVQAGLALFLEPRVHALDGMLTAAEQVVIAQSPDLLVTQVDTAWTQSVMASAADQRAVITGSLASGAAYCDIARGNLTLPLIRIGSPVVAQFQQLGALPAANVGRKGCLDLRKAFGEPWIRALGSLTQPELTRIVSFCGLKMVRDTLVKRLTAQRIHEMDAAVALLAAPGDVDLACGKIASMGYTRIALPPGVTAFGWQIVGQWLLPNAFSDAGYETDDACLKHMHQELHPQVSKATAEAYFADLVTACRTARAAWSHRVDKTVPLDQDDIELTHQARWHISIKAYLSTSQVFHVDGGYGKSPWRAIQ